MIGKLEELTLLACLRAGREAVPSEIYARVIEGQKGAAFGAVYTTLSRLAAKRFLKETAIKDEAGRARRAFTINAAGRQALQEALDATQVIGQFLPGGRDVRA